MIATGSYAVSEINDRVGEFFGTHIPLRNVLPEPVDYFDHVGNFAFSWYAAARVVRASARVLHARMPSVDPEQIRKRAVSVAVATGVLLNAIVESKIGAPLLTSDPVDFAYGVGGAVFGAMNTDLSEFGRPVQADPPIQQPGV